LNGIYFDGKDQAYLLSPIVIDIQFAP